MKKIEQVFKLLVICGLFGSSVFAGPTLCARRSIRQAITAQNATEFEAAVRQHHSAASKVELISFFRDAVGSEALKAVAEELAPDVFTEEELEQLGVTLTPAESAEIRAIRAAIIAVGVDAFNDAVRTLSEAVRRDDRAVLIELFREASAVEGWRDAVTARAREIFTVEEFRDNLGIPDPTPAPTPPTGGNGGSDQDLDSFERALDGNKPYHAVVKSKKTVDPFGKALKGRSSASGFRMSGVSSNVVVGGGIFATVLLLVVLALRK